MCVHVCVCVHVDLCVCMCVCVWCSRKAVDSGAETASSTSTSSPWEARGDQGISIGLSPQLPIQTHTHTHTHTCTHADQNMHAQIQIEIHPLHFKQVRQMHTWAHQTHTHAQRYTHIPALGGNLWRESTGSTWFVRQSMKCALCHLCHPSLFLSLCLSASLLSLSLHWSIPPSTHTHTHPTTPKKT